MRVRGPDHATLPHMPKIFAFILCRFPSMCMDVKFELIKKNAHNLLINALKGFFGSIWNFGVYHKIESELYFYRTPPP